MLRSKKAFSLLNKTRVASPDGHLVLFISLNWKLSLNFLFRHFSPDGQGLDFIIKDKTKKLWMFTAKIVFKNTLKEWKSKCCYFDFHGGIFLKSWWLKKRSDSASYFRVSGIIFTFALWRHLPGEVGKTRVIDINPVFQKIREDFSILLPLRAMATFLCWLWTTGVRHLKVKIEKIR